MNRPLSPEKIIELLARIASEENPPETPRGMQGAIIGIIESLFGSRGRRQRLLFKLFPGKWSMVGNVSTKDLLPGQWNALNRWVQPVKVDDDSPWIGDDDFVSEAALVMASCDMKEGQEHLENDNSYFEEFCRGKYGCIPVMECKHQATALTALWLPFCMECAEGGENKLAYTIKKELEDAQ